MWRCKKCKFLHTVSKPPERCDICKGDTFVQVLIMGACQDSQADVIACLLQRPVRARRRQQATVQLYQVSCRQHLSQAARQSVAASMMQGSMS